MVRYWSFIKTAAICIGDDTLEVQGSAAKKDGKDKRHHHLNFEFLGHLIHLRGYPVNISPCNNEYTIDLDKDFPGQKIEIKTFKEFVGVKNIGATAESFGDAVGITMVTSRLESPMPAMAARSCTISMRLAWSGKFAIRWQAVP